MLTYKSHISSHKWVIHNYDRLEYSKALEYQYQFWDEVAKNGNHHLMLLEHDPVITLGRRTDPEHLLLSKEELKDRGVSLYKIERGGSATYHGPGQLVGYIICKSTRFGGIHNLVKSILESIVGTLDYFGIQAHIDEENPGVWTLTDPPRKLAAVGMQNKNNITLHGFALNVDLPLTGFSYIVPCGLQLPVSTMAIETGKRMSVSDVKEIIIEKLISKL